MTNNKQQTEINAVEYLSKVNQFAKENNTDKPRQQTAVEWLLNAIETKNGEEFSSYYTEFIEQAKEMEKERMIQFAKHCLDKALDLDIRTAYSQVEKYYNETYGGELKNIAISNKTSTDTANVDLNKPLIKITGL